jgi:hypothetical protein
VSKVFYRVLELLFGGIEVFLGVVMILAGVGGSRPLSEKSSMVWTKS